MTEISTTSTFEIGDRLRGVLQRGGTFSFVFGSNARVSLFYTGGGAFISLQVRDEAGVLGTARSWPSVELEPRAIPAFLAEVLRACSPVAEDETPMRKFVRGRRSGYAKAIKDACGDIDKLLAELGPQDPEAAAVALRIVRRHIRNRLNHEEP